MIAYQCSVKAIKTTKISKEIIEVPYRTIDSMLLNKYPSGVRERISQDVDAQLLEEELSKEHIVNISLLYLTLALINLLI